jgi:hypothetical protein
LDSFKPATGFRFLFQFGVVDFFNKGSAELKNQKKPVPTNVVLFLESTESRAAHALRQIVNCGADTPEMKYSGQTGLYHHHLYIPFGPIKKTAL